MDEGEVVEVEPPPKRGKRKAKNAAARADIDLAETDTLSRSPTPPHATVSAARDNAATSLQVDVGSVRPGSEYGSVHLAQADPIMPWSARPSQDVPEQSGAKSD